MTTLPSQHTPPGTPSSRHYVDYDEYIDFQLRKTRGHIKLTDLLTAAAGAITLVLTYLLLFVVCDQWIVRDGFAPLWRGVMLGGLAVATLLWLVWKIAIPYWKQVTPLYAAKVIERADKNLKSSLLNLVDLHRAGREVPREVRAAMEKRAAVTLSQIDVDEAVDRRPLMRLSYALLAVVTLCCLYTLFSPKKISSSILRAFLPTANVPVATKTEILEVRPGDVELPAGSQLAVTVDLRGDIPDRVFLNYTTADRRDMDEPVEMRLVDEVLHRYRGVITGENGRGILQNLGYTLQAGDTKTRDFQVTVLEPPSAAVEQVRYTYPAYMEREPRTQPGGHLDAWEGTTVTLNAITNMPVKTATVKFSDTADLNAKAEELRMNITGGTRLQAEWKLRFRSDGTHPLFYRIDCRNAKGEHDPSPTLYHIRILRDKPPIINLIAPTDDFEKPANATIPLLIHARDPDFKLRFISLRIEKQGQPLPWNEQVFDGDREGLQKSFRGTYDFPLKRLGLKPNDVISFWLEARDNKQPSGNRTNTPKLQVRILAAVSPQKADQQHQQDKQRGQDKLAADDPDLNQNETPKPQPRKEGPGEEPTGEGAGAKQKQSDGKSSKTKSTGGDKNSKTKPGDGQNSGQGTQAGDKRPRRDGPASDEEALRKLLEREQQAGRKPGENDSKSPNDTNRDDTNRDKGSRNTRKDGQRKEEPHDGKQTSGKPEPAANRKPSADASGRNSKPNKKNTADRPNEQQKPNGDTANDNTRTERGGREKQTGGKPGQQNGMGNTDDDKNKNGRNGSTGQTQNNNGTDDGTNAQQPGGKGMPTDPRSTSKNSKPGPGTKLAKTKPNGDSQQSTQPNSGTETPDAERSNAKKQKATGDETGIGTPDHDTQPDPTRAKNNIRRKDGTKPAIRNTPRPPGDPSKAPSGGADKSGRGSADARQGQPAPKRRQATQGDRPDRSMPSDKKTDGKQRPAATQGDRKPEGSDTLKGRNVTKQTNPDRSTGGKAGSGQQNDHGRKGSNQQGAGDASDQKGSNQPAGSKQTGQPKPSRENSSKSGSGGKSKSGGAKSGSSKSGGAKSTGGQNGRDGKGGQKSATGQGQGGKTSPSGKPSGRSTGGGGAANGPSRDGGGTPGSRIGSPKGPGAHNGAASGGSGPNSTAEKANLEYSRRAAALVLKRLQGELDRGKISPQLLKELGWTQADMQRFAGKLQKQLQDTSDDTSPEAVARRRQFEETLKSLSLNTRRRTRSGAQIRHRTQGAAVGSRRTPVPAEYRNAIDAYTRSLSKQR